MKVSSASGSGAARPRKGPAKVIQFPKPRGLRHHRAIRIVSIGIALGVCGALATRVGSFRGFRPVLPNDEGLSYALSAQELQILKLVNDARVRIGAPPLQFSKALLEAARMHSSDMAEHGYLGHDGPEGDTPEDRVRLSGIGYEELAENVYSDNGGDDAGLASRTVAGWLASPAHRANLLSPRFQASAVGIWRSISGKLYITEDFIR
jgi:uncharacterized protein YkwD